MNFKQSDIPVRGWAIESRVYAEDPYKNFGLPSVGRLNSYVEPTYLPKVRCDSGIEEGSEISIYYDPMICKLVTYGSTRKEAIDTHVKALDSYVIRGVTHNIALLRDILTEPKFVEGDINTKYLYTTYPEGFKGKQFNDKEIDQLISLASGFFFKSHRRSFKFISNGRSHIPVSPPNKLELNVQLLGKSYNVVITDSNKKYEITINGKTFTSITTDFDLAEPVSRITVDGEEHIVQLINIRPGQGLRIRFKGTTLNVPILFSHAAEYLSLMPEKLKVDHSKVVVSPMPGLVKSVACEVGQTVPEGRELCVIEAMKMQNSLVATTTGKIKAVHVKTGDTVEEEAVLVEFE